MKLLLMFIVFFVSGCAVVKEKPVVVNEVTVIEDKVPKELLGKCEIPEPPASKLYLESDSINKENMLTEYITVLLRSLKGCSNKIEEIKLKLK